MQEPRLRKVRKQPQGHAPSERQSQDFNTKPEALTILPIQKYRGDGDSCLPRLGRGRLLRPLRPEQCRPWGEDKEFCSGNGGSEAPGRAPDRSVRKKSAGSMWPPQLQTALSTLLGVLQGEGEPRGAWQQQRNKD